MATPGPAITAQRYIDNGISIDQIFRTDLGDDETRPDNPDHTGNKEWSHGKIPDHRDPVGDDDVDVLIRANGELMVEYRSPQ
ncbi:MAG: hypothetical protein GWN00_16760 [Aliifodinibius sp.]|nr:hypothetical protein [Fodinibius sp.]NIY26393.1 hypothetical protein [Fodinibius sp.]